MSGSSSEVGVLKEPGKEKDALTRVGCLSPVWAPDCVAA